jgi:hypothetical protein
MVSTPKSRLNRRIITQKTLWMLPIATSNQSVVGSNPAWGTLLLMQGRYEKISISGISITAQSQTTSVREQLHCEQDAVQLHPKLGKNSNLAL